MKILLEEPVDLELVADLLQVGIKRPSATPRDTSAWHVTNLLQSAHEITKGETVYHEYEGRPLGIMSAGRIWESAIDCYLTYYAVQQGGVYLPDKEVEKDGILGSLDGIMLLPDLGWLVCETKLRFTLNTNIPLNHLQQIRAYCYLAGMNAACYLSGYLSSTPPTMRATLKIIRFTQQSIDECWEGIVNTKEYLIKQGCHPVGAIGNAQ